MTPVERVTMDDAMTDLLRAEERIASLEADVETYREMVTILLSEVASQTALVRRLLYRIERERGRG